MIVVLAVIFGIVSMLLLFGIASVKVLSVVKLVFDYYVNGIHGEYFTEQVMGKIIGAVDLYFIGVVLLIFSFGLYELFISPVEASESSKVSGALRIKSLNDLKNRITKVIVMVLVVNFFQRVILMEFTTAMDMLFFALSIFALSFGLYFLHKNDDKDPD